MPSFLETHFKPIREMFLHPSFTGAGGRNQRATSLRQKPESYFIEEVTGSCLIHLYVPNTEHLLSSYLYARCLVDAHGSTD